MVKVSKPGMMKIGIAGIAFVIGVVLGGVGVEAFGLFQPGDGVRSEKRATEEAERTSSYPNLDRDVMLLEHFCPCQKSECAPKKALIEAQSGYVPLHY